MKAIVRLPGKLLVLPNVLLSNRVDPSHPHHLLQPLEIQEETLVLAVLMVNARVNGGIVVLDLNIVVMVAKPDLAQMVVDLLLHLLHLLQPLETQEETLVLAVLMANARVNGDIVVLDLNIVVMDAKLDLAQMVVDLLLPLHHLPQHLETTTTVEVAKFVLPQTLPKIQQLTGYNTVVKPKAAKTSVILELPLVFMSITAVKETVLPLEAYLVAPLLELLLDAFVVHFLLLVLSPLPS